jgi:hypothetical protein
MTTRPRGPLWPEIRLLFQAALAIFVLTVVVGILNGIDVLDPGHDTLMTHVHAGTLGWITLALAAVALWMFGGTGPRRDDHRTVRKMTLVVLGGVVLYVAAFWIGVDVPGDGIQRPIAGTIMFLAVAWVMSWMVGQTRTEPLTVPRLAMLLAWVSLIIGAVFGVILGLFISEGDVPGLSLDTAGRLADAHPPTMVVGYLILAGVGLAEWLLRGDDRTIRSDRAGLIQVVFVFAAGALLLAGLIADNEGLLISNGPLELIGIGIFFWRLRAELRPSAWKTDTGLFARMGVLGIAASLGFLLFLVQGVASGRYETDGDIPFTLILALDHTNFLGISTNLVFGAIAGAVTALSARSLLAVVAGTNVGLVGFAAGIAAEVTWLKRVFTPILGVALLAAVVLLSMRLAGSREQEPVAPGP